ncbi:hypothetical protein ABEB36_003240 [Hypothenemus hampei]|uniref:2',5'-phosphodiesterase 12 n=1 Tax=Hypothenemus hampei TaxID=57062 RepID=A0ABD1F980_HYPHA
MLSRVLKLGHLNILLHSSRYLSSCLPKMQKAYLRQCPDGEHFDFTFNLQNEQVKRQFNFTRKLAENVDVFLTRVQANLDKAISKKKKKKTEVNQTIEPVSVSLFINEKEVSREDICEQVFKTEGSIQLKINGTVLNVIVNAPWVVNLSLPASILSDFPTYPSKFESIHTDLSLSEFLWSKSKDKREWTDVGTTYIHVPKNSDVNYYLKFSCIPKNDFSIGPKFEAISSCKVEAGPGECPFEERHAFTKEKLSGNQFRVVSYNILADLYCDSDHTREVLFPYCPPYALSIDYRKQLILKEIIGYNADLLCLQEVDRKIYKYDLQPTLSRLGYESTYYNKGTDVAEGLAFFYNSSRFVLLDSEKLIFAQEVNKNPLFKDIWEKIQENEKLVSRVLARSTTLQLNVIGSLENNEVLIVANTHLYFHPDADHIRLLHGCFAIRYLENVASEIEKRYEGKRVSLIFCGDFNSVPSCGIYQLYTTGSLPGNFQDYSSNKDEAIVNIDIKQPFHLGSACGTPSYTNFTVGFADCLDYIFYDKSKLTVSQVVPFPSEEQLKQHSAIPSIVSPSDHIALISDLKWL